MPTNSDYDGFFAGIGGIPLFTYGMITTTVVVLAYMTIMEPDLSEEVIDTMGPNSSFMTPNAPPEENIEESPMNSDMGMMPLPSEEIPPIEGEGQGQGEGESEIPPENSPEELPPSESKGGKKRRKTKRRRPTEVYL